MSHWQRVGAYAIERSPWRIAKSLMDGATLYTLFDTSGVRYGHFESAEEAKAEAERIEMAGQA